ncbi:hypothetical protein ACRAQ6_14035 [Erythrobacter sp. HA6-11]
MSDFRKYSWAKRRRRTDRRARVKPRKGPSVAEQQMQLIAGRKLVLPKGADPELGLLAGIEGAGDE